MLTWGYSPKSWLRNEKLPCENFHVQLFLEAAGAYYKVNLDESKQHEFLTWKFNITNLRYSAVRLLMISDSAFMYGILQIYVVNM